MNIKRIFTKKRIIYGLGLVLVLGGGYYFFFSGKTVVQETLVLHAADFLQQVSVSGKVATVQNLDLSFEQSGIVRSVNVKVGDKVAVGKLIASQDTAQLSTQLQEMQAGIDLQKAKLNQLLAGASDQDIKIAQDSVVSAQQNVKNAYDNALITLNTAYNAMYGSSTLALTMQNTYFYDYDQQSLKVQDARLVIAASAQDAKNYLDAAKSTSPASVALAISQVAKDLQLVYKNLGIIRDQADMGVYYARVSSTDKTSLETQKTTINTSISAVASSQQSIGSYELALQQAENNVDLVKAAARPTDIAVFQAQIKQAEASAQNVLTQIKKRQIFSPINGVVTAVNAKKGGILSGGQIAISLISDGKFQIESYVPEIYISLVKVGNDADVTLDSYGQDKVFVAKVVSIDPSETVKDGVSTYKITLELSDTESEIRNGMSANVVITTNKKADVISVPQGVIVSRDGKKWVKVKDGEEVVEKMVVVGDISSSGQAEIISGLSEGQVVITK